MSYIYGGKAVISNGICWNDGEEVYGRAEITFSDVRGGHEGSGNIDADPRFVDAESGDYRLLSDSPCIDAGDPNFVEEPGDLDIDGLRRVWGGRIDMGAYEYGSFRYGDMNCDGDISFDDIDPFVLVLVDPEEYGATYPDCDVKNADVNFDGDVSFNDIDAFVECLIHGGCERE
jgi:hypothetical protein